MRTDEIWSCIRDFDGRECAPKKGWNWGPLVDPALSTFGCSALTFTLRHASHSNAPRGDEAAARVGCVEVVMFLASVSPAPLSPSCYFPFGF